MALDHLNPEEAKIYDSNTPAIDLEIEFRHFEIGDGLSSVELKTQMTREFFLSLTRVETTQFI